MESRDEAAPSHRTWKTPPNHHPRFPQLPQPLPLEKESKTKETQTQLQHPDTVPKLSSMSPVSVLDVPVGSVPDNGYSLLLVLGGLVVALRQLGAVIGVDCGVLGLPLRHDGHEGLTTRRHRRGGRGLAL